MGQRVHWGSAAEQAAHWPSPNCSQDCVLEWERRPGRAGISGPDWWTGARLPQQPNHSARMVQVQITFCCSKHQNSLKMSRHLYMRVCLYYYSHFGQYTGGLAANHWSYSSLVPFCVKGPFLVKYTLSCLYIWQWAKSNVAKCSCPAVDSVLMN